MYISDPRIIFCDLVFVATPSNLHFVFKICGVRITCIRAIGVN
jgi:hypothetical protein